MFAEAEVKAVPRRQRPSVVKSVGIGAIAYPVTAEHTTRPVNRNLASEL